MPARRTDMESSVVVNKLFTARAARVDIRQLHSHLHVRCFSGVRARLACPRETANPWSDASLVL